MIICGYQGIGKSSLEKSCLIENEIPVIDLESGNFWIDGKRSDDWYKIYANIAVHLSKQGNIVMLSSHKNVRDYLYQMNSGERLATIYPAMELKDRWINKLESRYIFTKKDKDYKALMNAKEMYEENIQDLSTQVGFDHIELTSIGYLLETTIETYISVSRIFTNEERVFSLNDYTIILKGRDNNG